MCASRLTYHPPRYDGCCTALNTSTGFPSCGITPQLVKCTNAKHSEIHSHVTTTPRTGTNNTCKSCVMQLHTLAAAVEDRFMTQLLNITACHMWNCLHTTSAKIPPHPHRKQQQQKRDALFSSSAATKIKKDQARELTYLAKSLKAGGI